MASPTTGILLNKVTPAAPTGDQNAVFQTDGATPQQSISVYPQKATSSLRGTVKPDNSTTEVDGSGNLSVAPALQTGCITILFDGGGSVPATGTGKPVQLPTNATITGWSARGNASGSFSMDLCFHAGSAPPSAPSTPNTTTDKISASAPISMSSAQTASGGASAISTWTTALTQWGSVMANLTSVTTCTWIEVQVFYTKS